MAKRMRDMMKARAEYEVSLVFANNFVVSFSPLTLHSIEFDTDAGEESPTQARETKQVWLVLRL